MKRGDADGGRQRKQPHCAIRARERYGIDLTGDDVISISRRCLAGEGRIGGNPDGARFHLIVFAERVLWVVYRPPSPDSAEGAVVTIMPPEIANVAVARDNEHRRRRTGDWRRYQRRCR